MSEAVINQLIAVGVPALATVAAAWVKGWFERRKADGTPARKSVDG